MHPEYAAESGEMPGRLCSALLSQHWKTLQNVTARPSEIGPVTREVLVLTLFEHKRLT